MQRKIEFRGKRKDTGKWIIGYLTLHGEQYGVSMIRPFTMMKEYKVDPETVGQYTGMCDRFGAKIFEGDIVKIRYRIGHEYLVYWDDTKFAWCAKNKETNILLSELQNYIEVLEQLLSIYDYPGSLEDYNGKDG